MEGRRIADHRAVLIDLAAALGLDVGRILEQPLTFQDGLRGLTRRVAAGTTGTDTDRTARCPRAPSWRSGPAPGSRPRPWRFLTYRFRAAVMQLPRSVAGAVLRCVSGYEDSFIEPPWTGHCCSRVLASMNL